MNVGLTSLGRGLGITAAWLIASLFAPMAGAQGRPCEAALGSTHIDYGRLSRATLPADARGLFRLPARTVALHIRCAEPRDMTVFFRDVPADDDGFRFTDHGHFTLRMRDGLLDGKPVDLGEVDRHDAVPGRIGAGLAWMPEKGLTPLTDGAVARGREFSAQVDIEAYVREQALTVSDATHWSVTGSVTMDRAAASPALTLQADATPGRCNVDVLRHLSFGHLRSTELDGGGASTRVPSTGSGLLQVRCDAPMPFALRVMRDERAGTAMAPVGLGLSYPDDQLFGLGRTAAGERIGAYVLHWAATASSDRGQLHALRSLDGGKSWVPMEAAVMADHANAERVAYGAAEAAPLGPVALKALDVTLDATIFIAPKHLLSLGEEIRADGLTTFEIIY